MRRPATLLILALLLAGCGGANQTAVSVNNSTTTTTKEPLTAEKPTNTATQSATPSPIAGEPPVEFTYLGVSPDKESAAYQIKVKTTEPISQVDLGVKYLDDAGKVLEETTFAWQNVVKSVRQPIEKGKTYEVKDELPQGATKAEYTLKRVIFQNGARWSAE